MVSYRFPEAAKSENEKVDRLRHLITAYGGVLVDTGKNHKWKLFSIFGQSLTAHAFLKNEESFCDLWNDQFCRYLTTDPNFHPQFFLNVDGTTRAEKQQMSPFAAGRLGDRKSFAALTIEMEITAVLQRCPSTGLRHRDLMPDWNKQKYSLLVPCKNSSLFFWGRCGRVSSLGEWFAKLSQPVSDGSEEDLLDAAMLWYAFVHKDPLSQKRFKDHGSKSHWANKRDSNRETRW